LHRLILSGIGYTVDVPKRIGIYAGTFDPVHTGHVAFAKHALEQCGLDEVVFFLERDPWRKPNATDIAHRLALLERALAGEPGLRVVCLEVGRFTPRLVLPELKELFGDDELVLLAGSDVARTLYLWSNVDELLAAVSIVFGLRSGDTAEDVHEALERLMHVYGPVAYQITGVPQPRVASTAARHGDHAVLHPEVSAYIKRHGLYGPRAQS